MLFFRRYWQKLSFLLLVCFCITQTWAANVYETIEVGKEPSASILTGVKLYVMNTGSNSVSVIDTTKNTVLKTIPVGIGPIFGSISAGNLYVSNS